MMKCKNNIHMLVKIYGNEPYSSYVEFKNNYPMYVFPTQKQDRDVFSTGASINFNIKSLLLPNINGLLYILKINGIDQNYFRMEYYVQKSNI